MKYILITGGLGYVGSEVLDQLIKNYKIVCIDKCIFKNDILIKKIKKQNNFYFHRICITNKNKLKKIFKQYNFYAVVHLAAIVGEPASNKDSNLTRNVNFLSSKHIFNLSRRFKIKKFIFSSTCSNYGIDNNKYLNEKSKLLPLSPYSRSKVNFEKFLLKNSFKDMSIYILRFATVFGLSKRMRYDLTINQFTRDIFFKSNLEVYGKDFWRPYIHVKDISLFIKKIILQKNYKEGITVLNVGKTENNFTKKMIIKKISKYLDINQVKFNEKKIIDLRNYKVDFSKIRKIYKFVPKYNIDYGIKELIKFLKKKNKKYHFQKIFVNH